MYGNRWQFLGKLCKISRSKESRDGQVELLCRGYLGDFLIQRQVSLEAFTYGIKDRGLGFLKRIPGE